MFADYESVLRVVDSGFEQNRVLVVGDLLLDRYIWGDVQRISPEAPVPVVRLSRETEAAGGAGNVALNLARLGLRVSLAGYVGDDQERHMLIRLLESDGVDTQGIVVLDDRPTITKTRIIGGHQQMIRFDKEECHPVASAAEAILLGRIAEHMANTDGVIISDYAKGVLSQQMCRAVIDLARKRDIPVLVDPKGQDYGKYRDATALTPNLKELSEITGVAVQDKEALLQAGDRLRMDLGLEFLIATRGEEGASLLQPDGAVHVPAQARDVFDVSGAGDTLISTTMAGLLAGLGLVDALHLANVAAGVVVGKVGTVPITRAELVQALRVEQSLEHSSKLYTLEQLQRQVDEWRARGERIVFTNGCFDLLHAGHVLLLQRARQEGHRLIVGLNSDTWVRKLKGEGRPILHQDDRAHLLAALASVDATIIFDEETPTGLIRALKPDILVKGGNYTEDQVVGASEVRSWNGRVVIIPLLENLSSSDIIRRIRGGGHRDAVQNNRDEERD